MAEERLTLLTAREAAGYLRISLFTLNKIQKAGRLTPFRTPGGHRRYSLEMLNEYLEKSRTEDLIDFTCPQCGTQQSFSRRTTKLRCHNCGVELKPASGKKK